MIVLFRELDKSRIYEKVPKVTVQASEWLRDWMIVKYFIYIIFWRIYFWFICSSCVYTAIIMQWYFSFYPLASLSSWDSICVIVMDALETNKMLTFVKSGLLLPILVFGSVDLWQIQRAIHLPFCLFTLFYATGSQDRLQSPKVAHSYRDYSCGIKLGLSTWDLLLARAIVLQSFIRTHLPKSLQNWIEVDFRLAPFWPY